MTGIRRSLALLGILAALVVATSLPASASFAASSALPTTTINTLVVAAPTNVVGQLVCAKTATMSATWTASTSPRISGYLVSVYFGDGFTQTVQLGATATSWSAPIAEYNVTVTSVRYSVTTQTSVGWTAESSTVGPFQC